MLHKILLGIWYLIVSILILLALANSVARGYPELYQKYLPTIQENISVVLGKPVSADSIRIDWQGITPLITTKNLSIFEDESQYDQLLNVDEAIINLDLFKSLINKKVIFKELIFVAGNLEVVRTVDEKIILNGIDISERLEKKKQFDQESKFKISLLDSSISINDEVRKLNYFFDRVDIALGFSGERFQVSSRFILPDTLGKTLELVADIRNLDKGLKNVKGTLYSKGEDINLELINDFFPNFNAGIKKANSDFQVWGDFNSLSKRSLLGSVNLRNIVYRDTVTPISKVKDQAEISSIDTKFQFNGDVNNWKLSLSDVSIQTPEHEWPGKQYEISCQGCEEESFVLSAALDYLNIDQIIVTLQHFPFIAEPLDEMFNKIEIHGELLSSKLQAELNQKEIQKYDYQTRLQGVGFSIPEYDFTASHLDGEVVGDHQKGSITLTSDSVTVALNKLLNQPLENQTINGLLSWKLDQDEKLFSLQNMSVKSNQMHASVQGVARIINDIPYVDIQLAIPEVQATTIKKYLPYKRMKPKLSKWLSESISGGTIRNGKLLIHGNPKNFPFKDKPGRFLITADIEEGLLEYRPSWPSARDIVADFEITNNYLELNAKQGSILDSSLTNVEAKIEDLKLPRLVINGSAAGPAKNILEYLKQSSLLPENSQVLKQISASGRSMLDLEIVLTLTKKLEKQRLVSGELEFKNAGIHVNALSLPFTDLNGKLRFDKNGADGKGITADLFGAEITAMAEKSNSGRTNLFLSGELDLDQYFSSNYTKLSKYLSGTAPITADIDIPKFGKEAIDKSLKINVESDLFGAKIALPEPFEKDFDDSRRLSIHTQHQKNEDSLVYANLNSQVFMQAVLDKKSSKLSKMEVRMGNEQFVLPNSGIKISGRLKQLDLSQWRALLNQEKENEISVNEISLSINQVSLGKLNLDNVDFNVEKRDQFWSGDITSSVAKGQFEYPVNADSGSVATANFDYLRFNLENKDTDEQATEFDPRSLPALVVSTKEFKYKDAVFTDVNLKTKPSENGLVIDSLQGKGKDLIVSANGSWNVEADDSQNTKLVINLQTKNIQNSLTGLGFDSAISKGEGRVAANFLWPSAPYQFSLASVAGNANLRFKDGVISSVEPGAGRLIGLVNLGEITRRLSLDFTDFFSKGYSFDKIRGDLVFKDANLTTDNLKIKGPSADVLIQGRTGITARDYDQVATVTPHVSGGLPWIGLAVGGPIGAVGVIVGEKIAKSIGMDVDKVTEVKYSMTGSWDDPKVEPIARKVADKNRTSQGQPSTALPSPNPQQPDEKSEQATP